VRDSLQFSEYPHPANASEPWACPFEHGTHFSDHGDSGSAILSTTGEVLGLLFVGNGTHTYACPIQTILPALRSMLA
jgi:hypothetical protein